MNNIVVDEFQFHPLKVVSLLGEEVVTIHFGDRNWADLGSLANGNYIVLLIDEVGSVLGSKLINKI